MKPIKQLIRKWLMGNATFSAYSKITIPGNIQEKVFLTSNGQNIDVSDNHWLLCIEPIVFGIWVDKEDYTSPTKNTACQMHVILPDAKKFNTGKAVSSMNLDLMESIEEEKGILLLLKLRNSKINYGSPIKSYLIFRRYYRKDGMTFNRFKSFVSAYSYPRRIRIISFRQDDYYNIFPMDLLGGITSHNRYVFGLRHTNVALPKILASGKIVVCEVAHTYKDIIYQLGNHHSSTPPSPDKLPFKTIPSKNFAFPVPEWVESYKEIEITRSSDMGSHMLMWGSTTNEIKLAPPADHLFLIHFLHYLYQKNSGDNYKLL